MKKKKTKNKNKKTKRENEERKLFGGYLVGRGRREKKWWGLDAFATGPLKIFSPK